MRAQQAVECQDMRYTVCQDIHYTSPFLVFCVDRARREPGGRPKRSVNVARNYQRPAASFRPIDFAHVHVPITYQQQMLHALDANSLSSQRFTYEPSFPFPTQTSRWI